KQRVFGSWRFVNSSPHSSRRRSARYQHHHHAYGQHRFWTYKYVICCCFWNRYRDILYVVVKALSTIMAA
ncbi:hypothetical protein SK128_012682, partial [Halocaridina rubra]